jgi:hypothetical protein
MEVLISLNNVTSAGTGTSTLTFSIPSGHTIDFTKLPVPATAGANQLGSAESYGISAAGQYDELNAVYANSSTTLAIARGQTAVQIQGQDIPLATVEIGISASFPIAEWAGSGTVNVAQNDVEWFSNSETSVNTTGDSSKTQRGPSGADIVSNTTSTAYQLAIPNYQVGDTLDLEYYNSTVGWLPASAYGDYDVPVGRVSQGSTSYGASIRAISAGIFAISFGDYAGLASTYGGAGTTWATVKADTTSGIQRWRVRKSSAGAAVGFGIADTSSSGLVPSGTYAQTNSTWTLGSSAGTTGQHQIRAENNNVGALQVRQRSTTTGQSYGLDVQAGTNGSDAAQRWYNAAGSTLLGEVKGNAVWTFGNPSNTSFPGNNIVGRKDGSAVAAGYVGEIIVFTQRSVTTTATGAFRNEGVAALATLTAGVWDYRFMMTIFNGSAVVRTIASISTTQTDGVEDRLGTVLLPSYNHKSGGTDSFIQMVGSGFVRLSSSTPIYPKAFNLSANLEVVIDGYAIRIA